MIAASTSALDAIDPNSETAVTEMFDKLEEINSAFQEMAALEVPEEFSSIEAMADNAAFYMNEALTLYHFCSIVLPVPGPPVIMQRPNMLLL